MSSSAIEALYIFNSLNNERVLEHVYRGRPASSSSLLSLYLAQPTPRPPLTYFPGANPPTTLFSISYTNLLIFAPISVDTETLFVLEFLHRLVDVLEAFLGAPLLAAKIEANYDVVAQLLGEICDAGNVANTEPDTLREVVSTPGFIDNFLGGLGLPGSAPSLSSSNTLKNHLARRPPTASQGPAIPWRRSNVRHTSNELYVDIVESLSVTLAPSGRPLAAFAHGTILFTAKISGVPDLLLTLTNAGGGKQSLTTLLSQPTFHPCVRLARWTERPGELSFVPPDGKFVLAGYTVDLLPPVPESGAIDKSVTAKALGLPVAIDMYTSLGPAGLDFEARLALGVPGQSTSSGATAASKLGFGSGGSGVGSSGRSTPSFFGPGGSGSGSSSAPVLQPVVVTIPIPAAVRNMTDLRPSRGEASFSLAERVVEWRISAKEVVDPGSAVLRCTAVGDADADADADGAGDGSAEMGAGERAMYGAAAVFDAPTTSVYDYDETADAEGYQGTTSTSYATTTTATSKAKAKAKAKAKGKGKAQAKDSSSAFSSTTTPPPDERDHDHDHDRDHDRVQRNKRLMPRSAAVSFSVKGWLASGIKVESLVVDARRSRGLGDGVKPVKGVKYTTVSKKGLETRC